MSSVHLSLAAASFAAFVNAYQAWLTCRHPHPFRAAWAITHSLICIISLFYVGAFLWLILCDPDRGNWSETVMPVSVVAFVVVWSLPAIIHSIEHTTRNNNRGS